MLDRTLKHPVINTMLVIGMIGLTLICIVKIPDVVLLKRIARHATQIMLILLGAGLLFFIINQKRLLFTAFGCTAALCIYFKYAANISLAVPVKTSERSLTIIQTNTSDIFDEYHTALEDLIDQSPDVINFIEVTPDWERVLLQTLSETYPYHALVTRIDIYGTAIFSKYPMEEIDTVFYEIIPNLSSTIALSDRHRIKIITSNSDLPLYRISFEKLRNQLDILSSTIRTSPIPVITSGNYNLDQFSDELQDFRAVAGLEDSRKTMSPSLNPPTNHLFYSQQLECLRFTNVYDRTSSRIGIMGEYQFKSDEQAYQKRN